jgi:hypothetical protein
VRTGYDKDALSARHLREDIGLVVGAHPLRFTRARNVGVLQKCLFSRPVSDACPVLVLANIRFLVFISIQNGANRRFLPYRADVIEGTRNDRPVARKAVGDVVDAAAR